MKRKLTARQAEANRARGKQARAHKGAVARRSAALEAAAERTTKGQAVTKPLSPSALDARARKMLGDLRIKENTVTLAEARRYAQLLDAVDRAYANPAGDGRTLGALGTISKQATEVLTHLRQMAELHFRDRPAQPSPTPAPTTGLGPKSQHARRPTTTAPRVDHWGLPLPPPKPGNA